MHVIDAWHPDGDGPAFLNLIENDHYALGKNFKRDQGFYHRGRQERTCTIASRSEEREKKGRGGFSKTAPKRNSDI
jgi:hypothetical protein